ncbi:MAG: 3'-5' exonuclease [Candidatus Omnitrophica bacterium]|nr:3'-5' exonuclease [Candidatus Omnitrophota bacterium]
MKDKPAYLIFDTESIPDGRLLATVKYPKDKLSSEEAIARAQQEALDATEGKSNFLPVTFQIPVAIAVGKVDKSFRLTEIVNLDAPKYEPRKMVADFWAGVETYASVLVTFNGRQFDLPLLELAAFRYGIPAVNHFTKRYGTRDRYGKMHLDLMEWFSNYGAIWRFTGGLNLVSKLLGKPGKMETTGQMVYDMYKAGELQEINQYCMFDVLDTYFVFLRTRVLEGALELAEEQRIVAQTRDWLEQRAQSAPHLKLYLENWGEWSPWP